LTRKIGSQQRDASDGPYQRGRCSIAESHVS
jgi:hypothetical protein